VYPFRCCPQAGQERSVQSGTRFGNALGKPKDRRRKAEKNREKGIGRVLKTLIRKYSGNLFSGKDAKNSVSRKI
jgi:hypothetical protein